jgi:glycosyltransferase involved in cell wall biosynthesis
MRADEALMIRSSRPANILIVEEALQSGHGHWPLYIGDLAAAFRKAGDHVDVLVHRHADPELVRGLQATPWLSRNCWSEPSRQGGFGGLRHALRYGRELHRWLQRATEPTWVCALTMRLQHLLAFSLLCRWPWHHRGHRYLLLFVQGFGVYQGPGMPVRFSPGASTQLARWCFKRLAPAVAAGRVVLAAETRAMQAELECFSKLPVRLFPHPVSLSTEPSNRSSCRAPSAPNGPPITITCPGFARYEKGNDLLQDACRLLFAAEPSPNLRVISQWPHPFNLPDGSQATPAADLLADGRYQLINHSLDRQAYASLLACSNLIVLPYRRSSYHNRVSRVAIEAALQGIPLVYMHGTWIEEVVELTVAGVAIADENPAAVAEAIRAALEQLPTLQKLASKAQKKIESFYSTSRFRELLFKP